MSKNPFPVRMCSGCMKRFPKNELVRIVRREDGKAIVDDCQCLPGRGVYVCLNSECIKKAEKRNWFSRSLRADINKEIYRELTDFAEGK